MQYTIRNMPAGLDRAIRDRARTEGKSLNDVTIDALMRAFGLAGASLPPQRDLTEIAGSWEDDPRLTAALEEQRRVDPELWQ